MFNTRYAPLTYNDDYTLPSLVYRIMLLLKKLITDVTTKEILIWEEHLLILSGYLYFSEADVRIIVRSILNVLMRELEELFHTTSSQDVKFKTLHNRCFQIKNFLKAATDNCTNYWPEHLIRPSLSILYKSTVELNKQYEDYLNFKICANPNCNNSEIRFKQFISCRKCRSFTWYCCKGCQNTHLKVHEQECARLH